MKLFVYGTLLKGLERESVLAESKYLGTVVIQARMFNLGNYPGIIDGEGQVIGEIYEIDQPTLNKLDQVEGYFPDEPKGSEYIRKEVRIVSTEIEDTVVAYFYNQQVEESDRILSGDYRKYRLLI